MEKGLEEILVTRSQTNWNKLLEKSNPRIAMKDFSEIKHKTVGNLFAFYHPVYARVNN